MNILGFPIPVSHYNILASSLLALLSTEGVLVDLIFPLMNNHDQGQTSNYLHFHISFSFSKYDRFLYIDNPSKTKVQ